MLLDLMFHLRPVNKNHGYQRVFIEKQTEPAKKQKKKIEKRVEEETDDETLLLLIL